MARENLEYKNFGEKKGDYIKQVSKKADPNDIPVDMLSKEEE